MTRMIKCSRCGKRLRNLDAGDGWNVTMSRGVVVGVTCPACQTDAEDLEAQVNEATVEYGTNSFGRLVGRPKDGAL